MTVQESTAPEEEAAEAGDALGLLLAPKLGATIPTSKLGVTFFGGLNVGYLLPVGLPIPIGIAFEFAYLKPSYENSASSPAVGNYDYDLSQRLFVLALDAFVQVPMGALTPYGGIGYGIYLLRSEMDSFGMTNTETQTRAGLQLHGGAGYRLGPGDVYGELRYHYTNLRFDATGKSNAGGVTIGVGYRLVL